MVAAALIVSLVACGSDAAGPQADPSPTTPAASTPSPSESSTASGDPTSPSSTPTSPSVVPSTGREVSIGDISMRIPDGWDYRSGGVNPFSVGGDTALGSRYATISSTPDLSGGYATLDSTVKNLILSSYPDRAPKRLADREIDGVLFARLKGPTDDTFEVDHLITVYRGNTLEIEFDLVRADGKAANTALVEASLATVQIS